MVLGWIPVTRADFRAPLGIPLVVVPFDCVSPVECVVPLEYVVPLDCAVPFECGVSLGLVCPFASEAQFRDIFNFSGLGLQIQHVYRAFAADSI